MFDDLNASFDQNRLNAYMQSRQPGGGMQGGYGLGPQNAMATAAPQPQKPEKNFFVDQISTVGGILGGIGGGIAGGAAGFGIGAVPGAAAGGAAGSALGETLENILTGNNLGDNVLKEAALGGVFAGGPLKLVRAGLGIPGAVAPRGAGSALGAGAKTFAGEAAEEGGEQVLKTGFTGRMVTSGNKALASQYGTISKPVARETRPLETIGKLADMGITKPQDAERIARSITGSNGILTEQVAKAIGSAGTVSVNKIPSVVDDAIVKNGLSGLTRGNALSKMVQANIDSIKAGGNTPDAVMRSIRSLEAHANEVLGRGGTSHLATSTDKQVAKAIGEVTDALKDRLYSAAGANKNIKGILTPELREQLLQLNPKSNEWARFVNQKVMKANSVGDLRSLQSPFVRIGKIIDEGDINDMTFGGRVGNSFGGPGGITGRIADAAVNMTKNPTARFTGKNLRDTGTGEIGNQGAKGLAGTAFNLGAINMMANGGQSSPASLEDSLMSSQSVGPNMASQSSNPNDAMTSPTMNNSMGGAYQQMPQGTMFEDGSMMNQQQSANPYSRDALLYDLQRDPANADKYIAYFQELDSIFGASAADPMADLSQTSRSALASSDNALNTVTQLEDLFNTAGGAGGRIGGTIKNAIAGAGQNSVADVYNKRAQSSVTQIAKALAGAGGGTVSDMDAKVIVDYLPRFNDTPEEARLKFNYLRQSLEAAKNNTLMYGGGGQEQQPLQPQYGGLY